MSLEQKMEELTAALVQNNELLAISNAARAEALAAINSQESDKPAGTTRTRRTKAEIAADQAAAEKVAAGNTSDTTSAPAANVSSTQAAPVAAETSVPTVDQLRSTAVTFSSVDGDEKVKRTAFMKAVIEEVGIPADAENKRKIVNAAPEDRAKIIGWLEAFARGEKVNFSADDGEAPVPDDDDIG